jgi:pimeloyl-ACP methyl ester carboxylesterase
LKIISDLLFLIIEILALSSRIKSDSFSEDKIDNTIIKSYIRYYLRLPIQSEYIIDDMAADAISVLDELNIDKAHILGISMGGMIAQIIASNYPARKVKHLH